MAKKLYVVEITHTLVVLADDETDASEIAWGARHDVESPDVDVSKMEHAWYPAGWDRNCNVYHDGHGDITMEQAIEIAGIKTLGEK